MRRQDVDYDRHEDDLPSEPPAPFVVELEVASPGPGASTSGPWQGTRPPITGRASSRGNGSLNRIEVQLGSGAFAPADSTGANWSTWQRLVDVGASGDYPITIRAI